MDDALVREKPDATDALYRRLASEARLAPYRDYVEDLWTAFRPFADPNFTTDIAHQFHPRFWEMYLGCAMIDLGFSLIPRPTLAGPDLGVQLSGSRLWIEAAAPGHGQGPDAVPDLVEHDMFEPLPEAQVILRFTAAVLEKARKFEQYLAAGLVARDDVCVAAISGGAIWNGLYDDPMPLIVRSLFPVGGLQVTLAPDGTKVSEGFAMQRNVPKKSGAAVPTEGFMDGTLQLLAGVLFSNSNLGNHPAVPGADFIFIHNPTSTGALPLGWFHSGKEFWLADDQLMARRLP